MWQPYSLNPVRAYLLFLVVLHGGRGAQSLKVWQNIDLFILSKTMTNKVHFRYQIQIWTEWSLFWPIFKKKRVATADASYSVLTKRTKERSAVTDGTTCMFHLGVQASNNRYSKTGVNGLHSWYNKQNWTLVLKSINCYRSIGIDHQARTIKVLGGHGLGSICRIATFSWK